MIAPSSLPITPSPTPSPTGSPTLPPMIEPTPPSPTIASPTSPVLQGDNGPTETVTAGGDGSTTIQSIAAAMVGVSSAIIVCALALYASDLRERRVHAKWAAEHNNQDVVDDNSSQKSAFRSRVGGESQTSAGSMHGSNAESGYWVHAHVASTNSTELVEYKGGSNPQNMLPPMIADEARAEDTNHNLALTRIEQDDASISRVSTLTMSLKEGGYSYGADIEEKLSRYAIESSSNVTELDDAHRVSGETKLTSLVQGDMPEENDASVCSSLTNGSQSTAKLIGEDCLDVKLHQTPDRTPLASPFASLEVSPDTPHVEEEDAVMESDEDDDDFTIDSHEAKENELAQLEHLLAGIPFDELSQGTPAPQESDVYAKSNRSAHVRDVCFVPYAMEGIISFGLELFDAASEDGFPTASEIDLQGPLAGKVFVGDAIVAVNEKDTSGFSSNEVIKLCVGARAQLDGSEGKTIKLTVMTMETKDGEEEEEEDDSIDLESATEI